MESHPRSAWVRNSVISSGIALRQGIAPEVRGLTPYQYNFRILLIVAPAKLRELTPSSITSAYS